MGLSATELRIGNWVMGDTGKPFQIELSDFSDWYNDHNSHEYGNHVLPIPLTEEWLLKFGFVKDGRHYAKGVHQRIFSGLMKLKFNRLPQMWIFSIGSCSDITRVQYVHQLQNLYYALTGKEL